MGTGSRSPSCALRRSPSKKSRPGLRVAAQRQAGAIVSFEVTGHAGFASIGEDIVCAAVSALVLTAAYGLVRHCGAAARIEDDADLYVLSVAGGGNARAQAVLETTLSGLRAIARSYPRYLTVTTHSTGARRSGAEKSRPRKGA
jgi:uncharacterized protein